MAVGDDVAGDVGARPEEMAHVAPWFRGVLTVIRVGIPNLYPRTHSFEFQLRLALKGGEWVHQ